MAQAPELSAEYTIELLHTPRVHECDRTKQESFVDMSNGTFKVARHRREPHGHRPAAPSAASIAPSSRSGFLKFVYFTD